MTGPSDMDAHGRDPWSITTQDLYEALQSYRDEGTPAVVATIVDVEGSAYRRPGAKMVIDPDSESLGAITAGCLEGPVVDVASDVLESDTPTVETFDLMDDDEWGLGLGCNGIIDILLEPLDGRWDVALSELDDRRPVAMCTVLSSDDDRIAVGDRITFDRDGAVCEQHSRRTFPDIVGDALDDPVADLKAHDGSAPVSVETAHGDATVFVDWVTPAPDLLLFGNQNDIHPVSRIAHEAGFRVVVASARGARADTDQFPHAHEVRTARPTDIETVVDDPERTYAVLMSHNFLEDRLSLASLLDTDVPYVGLMGPRKRFDEMREALIEEEDRELTPAELDRIATPVGLDVGGGEPVQIALSIVTEALAVHNGREGGRLRAREGTIHSRLSPGE